MLSLTTRLLIAVSIVLSAFLGITGYALDKAYQQSAKEAVQQRLLGHVMTLIAAATVKPDGSIVFPEILPVARFNQKASGLYAIIVDSAGGYSWKSTSMGETHFQPQKLKNNTETFFQISTDSHTAPIFNLAYAVTWDTINKPHLYTINVVETFEAFDLEISRFRHLLWSYLGGVSLLLLLVQAIIWRWSLNPLRNAAEEIVHIEQGIQTNIEGRYPVELRALTNNLNALISSNKNHLSRHRNALSDLAHSLKTPLALMRSATENYKDFVPLKMTVSQQVDQMQKIIDYQLQRAATSGRIPLSKPVALVGVVLKIVNTLAKVYADKSVIYSTDVNRNSLFYGDESDLFELLGNLLDNAFKWCNQQVKISISELTRGKNDSFLLIVVEDDGPGIDQDIADRIMERGVTSEKKQGTGIGLAIVKDIVDAYEGDFQIGNSSLGGACFEVRLKQKH